MYPPESKSDSLSRFVGRRVPTYQPQANSIPESNLPAQRRFYQDAFGEAAFTAAGFEGWLLTGIDGEDGLPAPKCRTAAALKQAKANTANQDHRVV